MHQRAIPTFHNEFYDWSGKKLLLFESKVYKYLDVFVVEHDELFDARLLAMTSPCLIKHPLGFIEKDLNL